MERAGREAREAKPGQGREEQQASSHLFPLTSEAVAGAPLSTVTLTSARATGGRGRPAQGAGTNEHVRMEGKGRGGGQGGQEGRGENE